MSWLGLAWLRGRELDRAGGGGGGGRRGALNFGMFFVVDC